jgi:hypothetical protein
MTAAGNLRPDYAYASCTVVAQVGPVYSANEGFGTVTRNGAGDYSMLLAGLPSGAVITLGTLGSAFAAPVCEPIGTPVTALRVRTFDAAGVAIEASFCICITKA